MKVWTIKYISRVSGKEDSVTLTDKDALEFGNSEPEAPTNIIQAIIMFEEIARRWWGTQESRDDIVNIQCEEV